MRLPDETLCHDFKNSKLITNTCSRATGRSEIYIFTSFIFDMFVFLNGFLLKKCCSEDKLKSAFQLTIDGLGTH